jgi:hypothetical protein
MISCEQEKHIVKLLKTMSNFMLGINFVRSSLSEREGGKSFCQLSTRILHGRKTFLFTALKKTFGSVETN